MDILEKQIAGGAPVTVLIRGTERPLSFKMHAVILYKQLTGESLFVRENYQKIDVRTDPERWLKCLWAGLHEFSDGKWAVPYTFEELEALVDFSNAGEISVKMADAITRSMPQPDVKKKGESELPESAPITIPTSDGSTSEHAGVSACPEPSS